MCQLIPEIKHVYKEVKGIHFSQDTTESPIWHEWIKQLKDIDRKSESIKKSLIVQLPEYLRQTVTDALSIKKNHDRLFSAFLGGLLVGKRLDKYLKILIALDIFDFSVILLDDILDGADRRAGRIAHNKKWGVQTTISVAMILESLANKLVVESSLEEDKKIRIIQEMNTIQKIIYEGQFLDCNFEGKKIEDTSIEDYIEMIKKTTGYQIGGAFKIGGIVADTTPTNLYFLYKIGTVIGTIWQIRDDIIDYIPDEKRTWKTPFLDFIRNKKRIPLIIAMKNANAQEKKRLLILQKKKHLTRKEQNEIIGIIFKKENIIKIQKEIDNISEKCLELLKKRRLNEKGTNFVELFLRFGAGEK